MPPGLLIVDVQRDYFPGGRMELERIEDAASTVGELLSFFRKKQWPVFYIQHVATGSQATFFLPDSDGIRIHESLRPLPDEPVIVKHFPNSFLKTTLAEVLTEAGITQIVICGAMSHMCIDATTRAAADLGFECIVIHDGCATRCLDFDGETIPAAHVHGAFMAALKAAYAKVMRLEAFLRTFGEK